VYQIIDKIKTNYISDNEVNRIVAAIAERECSKRKSYINSVSSQYSDVDFLKTCEVGKWVNDRNNVVCSFLTALCGKKYSDMSTSEKKTEYE
jgi:hypothetical protein